MFKRLYRDYILKYYKIYCKPIIIGLGCLVIISYIILIYQYENKIKVISKQKEAVVEKEVVSESKEKYYYVDVKGAVNVAGVYKMEDGSRVIDAINMAGGLILGANTSVLNLSKKISDEMTIIIYTNDEIKQFKDGNKEEIIKYIEKECKCPDPQINDACIDQNVENNDSQDNQSTKISINTATQEQLMTLPSIGESKAKAIIDYRNNNGSFSSVDDIKNVTGIGDSIFDKIKDYITI